MNENNIFSKLILCYIDNIIDDMFIISLLQKMNMISVHIDIVCSSYFIIASLFFYTARTVIELSDSWEICF